MRRTLPVVVLLLVGGLYALAFATKRDPRVRNLEVLPADMVDSPAAESGRLVAGFPDRLVQRTPPAGTVPRDALLLDYGPTPEEAARAGRELVDPEPASPEALERGAQVFANVCATCHGIGGLGDGAVTKRGVPPPPSFLRPESKALGDGEMFHAVTFGRKNMPALAAQVTPEDRWRAIRHVRTLQEAAR
jgi:mono/diheme cytochrome c family protein